MKILFIVPPWRTTDALVAQLYPMPYAAVCLAAVLQAAGHDVTIKDFLAGEKIAKSKAKPPASFEGKGAPPYIHYGEPLNLACEWVRDHAGEYDAVGLMLGQCNLFETGFAIAKSVKLAGVPLVVGGSYATTAPDEVAAGTEADVLVMGEGEGVVCEAFETAYKAHKDKKPRRLKGSPVEFEAQPLPAWDLAPPSGYPKFGSKRRGVMTISRGCPWTCTFCSVYTVHSRNYRTREAERIREEILELYRTHGVTYLCFLDDNLIISEKRADVLLGVIEELRESEPGFKKVRFYVEEGLEIRMAAKPGLIARLVELGFDNVAIGLETMNDARREAMRKPYNKEDLLGAIEQISAAGLAAKAFYIIGFPGDTVDSVCSDLVEFGKLGLAARPNNLKLYPGTDATLEFVKKGWAALPYDWRLSSFHTPEGDGMDFQTIKKLKTVLGAIGNAAETLGIAVFRDSFDEIYDALRAHGYKVEIEDGGIFITGKMFRPTPLRHLAVLLLLRQGAEGVRVTSAKAKGGKNTVIQAHATAEPQDDVQAAMVRVLAGEDPPELQPAREMPTGGWAEWLVGDSAELDSVVPESEKVDFVFSCPPYYNLEQYSDAPEDLSNAETFEEFVVAYRRIIAASVARLRDDRFACFVVGEVRDKRGHYIDLVGETVRAFRAAGLEYYNEAILVTAVGSLCMRAGRTFAATRKLGKTHQNVLVFVKGDPRKATEAIGETEFGDVELAAEPAPTELTAEVL